MAASATAAGAAAGRRAAGKKAAKPATDSIVTVAFASYDKLVQYVPDHPPSGLDCVVCKLLDDKMRMIQHPDGGAPTPICEKCDAGCKAKGIHPTYQGSLHARRTPIDPGVIAIVRSGSSGGYTHRAECACGRSDPLSLDWRVAQRGKPDHIDECPQALYAWIDNATPADATARLGRLIKADTRARKMKAAGRKMYQKQRDVLDERKRLKVLEEKLSQQFKEARDVLAGVAGLPDSERETQREWEYSPCHSPGYSPAARWSPEPEPTEADVPEAFRSFYAADE